MTLKLEQFPNVISALDTRSLARFQAAIESINVGIKNKKMPNPEFLAAKSVINRALEDAWRKSISDPFFYSGRWESQPQKIRDINDAMIYVQLHTVAALSKRLKPLLGKLESPALDAMALFHREIEPLAEAFNGLKPLVVKRQVRDAAEVAAEKRALPAHVTGNAKKAVQTLLEALVDDNYQQLVVDYAGWSDACLASVLKRDAERPADQNREIPRDPNIRDLIYQCTEVGRLRTDRLERRPDASEIIQRLAERNASFIRDGFIYKNLKKLASIISLKGNLIQSEIVSSRVSLSGLEGGFRFTFADGSEFTANNSVVISRSIHNKTFARFPLTFHDVKLPGGTLMPRPSEQKMNEQFLLLQSGYIAADESAGPSLEVLGIRLEGYDAERRAFAVAVSPEALVRLKSIPDVVFLKAPEEQDRSARVTSPTTDDPEP